MRISDWSSDVCSSDLVYVDVNDRVTKGQVLARLDTSRLIDTVNQSRAALAAAEAGVGAAQAPVAETPSNLARLQQVSQLSGCKVPSTTELDAGRANYSRAMASFRFGQAQVVQNHPTLRTTTNHHPT